MSYSAIAELLGKVQQLTLSRQTLPHCNAQRTRDTRLSVDVFVRILLM